MSSGYASRLSDYKDKGVCGLPEIFDSHRALQNKLKKLVQLIRDAKGNVVVITGAGISTSAGIPDFRGPSGVWTKEKEQKQQQQEEGKANNTSTTTATTTTTTPTRKRKRQDYSHPTKGRREPKELENFSDAQPTLCHCAITKLATIGKVKYCITQNVDGLHRRSGLSRSMHCSVHGCVFTEKCRNCQAEFFRDYDVGGMSFQPTGRHCTECKDSDGNQGILCDTLLDWEDALPEEDFERAQRECEGAVVLCLGTSLRIEPVGSLPQLARQYIIVNLQKTPMDDGAALIIRAPVDTVMDQLLIQLGHAKWKQEDPPPIERVWKPKPKKQKRASPKKKASKVEKVETTITKQEEKAPKKAKATLKKEASTKVEKEETTMSKQEEKADVEASDRKPSPVSSHTGSTTTEEQQPAGASSSSAGASSSSFNTDDNTTTTTATDAASKAKNNNNNHKSPNKTKSPTTTNSPNKKKKKTATPHPKAKPPPPPKNVAIIEIDISSTSSNDDDDDNDNHNNNKNEQQPDNESKAKKSAIKTTTTTASELREATVEGFRTVSSATTTTVTNKGV